MLVHMQTQIFPSSAQAALAAQKDATVFLRQSKSLQKSFQRLSSAETCPDQQLSREQPELHRQSGCSRASESEKDLGQGGKSSNGSTRRRSKGESVNELVDGSPQNPAQGPLGDPGNTWPMVSAVSLGRGDAFSGR
jgi:hypothetical protein